MPKAPFCGELGHGKRDPASVLRRLSVMSEGWNKCPPEGQIGEKIMEVHTGHTPSASAGEEGLPYAAQPPPGKSHVCLWSLQSTIFLCKRRTGKISCYPSHNDVIHCAQFS